LYKERGLGGVAMGSPAIFGVGVQTYSPTASDMVHSMNSVMNHYKELLRQGRYPEAQVLWDKNKKIIETGAQLAPLQKTINQYDKIENFIEKSARFPKYIQKEKISNIKKKKNKLQEIMENKYQGIKNAGEEWVDVAGE